MNNVAPGVTQALARLAVEARYETLPSAVVEAAKLRILDTLGIMLAGARHPSTLISLKLAEDLGGHAAASVLGHRLRTSAPLAGYVNGIAAAAEEFDDLTKGADTHISASITPGVLAVAEQLSLSGRELIAGFAVGFEIAARIGRGMAPWLLDRGWHPNGITGALGVAAGAANMMRLDGLKTRMAIGIAASEASGVRRNVGSMAKAFHVGHGVRNGIFAALLAQKGFEVHPDIIEGDDVEGHGRFGLVDTFNGVGKYRLERMVDAAGVDWELTSDRTLVRLYPCSTAPSPAIDAMIELSRTHNLEAHQVSRIEWETTPRCWAIAPYPEATNSFTAKFCLPYLMAVALIDRKAGIEQFKDERVRKPDVQKLLRKVSISIPKDFERHTGHAWGENGVNWGEARLSVHLADGRVLKEARSYARGWPEQAASWDDLAEKYKDCAGRVLSASKIEQSLSKIRSLETLPSVGELVGVFTSDS
jgi:2-methylcitrate dehydratase PrpD